MNKRWITIPLRIIVTAVITLLAVYFYYKHLERKVVREMNSRMGEEYLTGENVNRDYKEAFNYFKDAADAGDQHAQYRLGQLYFYGDGTDKDFVQAERYLKLALDQGDHDEAEYTLAMVYLHSGKEQMQAIKLLQKSAKSQNTEAMCELANCHLNGFIVEQDDKLAEKYVKEALDCGMDEQDTDIAQTVLCTLYARNPDFKQDRTANFQKLKNLADKGVLPAIYYTAIAYEKGWGTSQNPTEMMKYLQKAADKGDPMAMTKLKEIKATNE